MFIRQIVYNRSNLGLSSKLIIESIIGLLLASPDIVQFIISNSCIIFLSSNFALSSTT